MARIRSIKPEFPQSETIGRLSRDARLLFVMLWTIVDDDGRARAASRMLASLLYPYDDDARDLIDGWLNELESERCIRLYQVDGSSYLEVTNWRKHQKIDKPSASKLPEFVEGSLSPREPSRTLATDLGPRNRIKEEEPSSLRSEGARKRASRLPDDFEPDLSVAISLGLTPEQAEAEAAKFKDHFTAAPGQRGVKNDWPATWRNWCRRAIETEPRHGRNSRYHSTKPRPHDTIFRALAEQAQAGNGIDQRQAVHDVGDGADRAGAGADSGPVIDLEAAAFRRAI